MLAGKQIQQNYRYLTPLRRFPLVRCGGRATPAPATESSLPETHRVTQLEARFPIGTVIRHRLFGYRGVVFDVDATFAGSEEWYQQMARSRPPKDAPWYRVLVDLKDYETYVAERNLEVDESGEPVEHGRLEEFFTGLVDGRYQLRQRNN